MSSESEEFSVSENRFPGSLEVYDRQTGGHQFGRGESLGLLYDRTTTHVLKHMPSAHSKNEIRFYEAMVRYEREKNEVWPAFIPRYFGIKQVKVDNRLENFIEMSDFTNGLRRPNILDTKLGSPHKPGDTLERIQRRIAKYPLFEELSFRLDGCRIYDPKTSGFTRLTPQTTNRSRNEIETALKAFLRSNDEAPKADAIVRSMAEQLDQLDAWFSQQRRWRFYCASVILAYETDGALSSRVALVDFVHTHPSDTLDDTCRTGLRNLRNFLAATRTQ